VKKKFFAMLLTAALLASQGVTVMAAGSAEAGGSSATIKDATGAAVVESASGDVTLSAISGSETIDSLAACVPAEKREAVKTQLSEAVKGSLSAIVDSMSENDRNDMSGFKMLSSAIFNVTTAGDTVKLRVPTLKDKNVDVYALHLAADGTWERIRGSKDGEYVTFVSVDGWSPVILVYKDLGSGSGSSTPSSSSTASGPAGMVASPQTGVASDWGVWMIAAVGLIAAAGALFRRTKA
jgi:LPXTG-motif cell wall-anchored protein